MAATKEEAPFLGSLADTTARLEALRAELATVEARRRALDEKANELNGLIAAYNTLRQAHGLAPA